MNNKPVVPAIEGWYTYEDTEPHLIGSRCSDCGTYYFPKQSRYCRNPNCDGCEFDEVPLSRRGKIWSYTNACYKPPEPYIAAEPFEPYTIAAVELELEQMIILGQVVTGVDVEALQVGQSVELVMETLYEDDESVKVVWKWKPAV